MSRQDLVMFVVVMGVSGSGKTTVGEGLGRLLDFAVLDADDLHPPANIAKMAAGQPLTDDDRQPWLEEVGTRAAALAAAAGGVVVACSALRRAHRDVLRRHGATRFVHLCGDRATIQGRVMTRKGHYMDASMHASQVATLESTDAEADVARFDIG
ncbi:MAG TPA: gluconokinase, GntK/IdnK-type, partial [Euzebya sp.]|nr:gluconokinase, GntK/IdnK-type [Euzebya sp.]